MNKILFSVIIPVYNVEKYLKQCVDVVLSQTYKDFEIILVDDGSCDNSPKICDEYSKTDSRVVVIHKKNGGLSDARNAGVKVANGEYLLFLDSDDYWNNNDFLEKLANNINKYNSDVILFKRKKIKITGNIKEYPPFNESDFNNSFELILEKLISKLEFTCSAVDKCIKRSVFINSNILFPVGMVSEDFYWYLDFIQYVDSISFVNDIFYIYRIREGSITQTKSIKNIEDFYKIIEKYSIYYKENNINISKPMLGYLCYLYMQLLGLVFKINIKTKYDYIRKLKKFKWLLDYNISKKLKLPILLIKILGIYFGSYILKQYITYKNK